MKYIITENQELKLILLRRLSAIDGLIDYYCNRVSGYIDFCNYPFEVFLEAVGSDIIDAMYYDYFSDLDDDGEEWGFLYKMMRKYIRKKQEKIRNYYDSKCNKHTMQDTITESKSNLLRFFKRRMSEVDEIIEEKVISYFEQHKCDYDLEYFISQIIADVDMEFEWFFGDTLDDDEIEEVPHLVTQYITERKLDQLVNHYNNFCSKQ